MCFLEFCEPLQQITEPQDGVMEVTSVVRSTDDNLGPANGICRRGQSRGAEPLTCGVCANSRYVVL